MHVSVKDRKTFEWHTHSERLCAPFPLANMSPRKMTASGLRCDATCQCLRRIRSDKARRKESRNEKSASGGSVCT